MRRAAVLLLLLCGCTDPLASGNAAFRAGEFRRAAVEYQQVVERDPSSAAARYNLGTALLRLGEYPAAAPHLDAARRSHIPALRQHSAYNRGNAELEPAFSQAASPERDASLQRAIAAYKQALLLNPADRAAKWNLELALRLLRPPEPPQGGGGGGGNGGGGGGGQARAQQNPRPSDAQEGGASVSREQAEQILRAAEQQDAALQRGRLQKGATRRPSLRDW